MARLYKKLHRASENSKTADVNDGLLFYLLVLIYVKTDKVTEWPKSCFHGWTNSPRLWAVKIGRGRIFPAMISTSHCEVIAFQREFIKSWGNLLMSMTWHLRLNGASDWCKIRASLAGRRTRFNLPWLILWLLLSFASAIALQSWLLYGMRESWNSIFLCF